MHSLQSREYFGRPGLANHPRLSPMMPQQSPAADEWLTVVTLRIFFATRTFAPSYREKLKKATSAKTQCSCSSLSILNPIANTRDLIRGLLPSDTFTIRFVIATPGKIERAKWLCKPDGNQEFNNVMAFRTWILSLATLLSELCEADHTRNGGHLKQWEFGVRPFRSGIVTNSAVCEDVRRILMTPLNPSEEKEHGMGYVYVLRSQMAVSTMAELKIGFSKFHPEHRAHELARCLARPEVVNHTPLLPHARRLESIIHAELQAYRKIQCCPKCCKEHREWFTVSHGHSREVVTRWGTWILKKPYVDGHLTDEWRDYLTKNDLASIEENESVAERWNKIIAGFPDGDPTSNKSQRIGEYLNDCYWDFTCQRLGLTHLGKDFCDTLRKETNLWHNGNEYSDEMLANLNKMATKLHDLDNKEDDGYDGQADKKFRDMLLPEMMHPGAIDLDLPFDAFFLPDAPIRRMYHPETKVRHLLNPDGSLGALSRLIRPSQQESKDDREYWNNFLDSFRNLETGSASFSHPDYWRTESPLGDATLLPVISLKDLEYVISPAANWVGMNPTNFGFQYLQEAYQNGKWLGAKPKFQLPKAYRRVGCKSLFHSDGDPGSSSGNGVKDRAKHELHDSGPMDIDEGHDSERKHGTFQLTREGSYNRFTWTAPVNDEFRQGLEHCMEEIRRGGLANSERRLAKIMCDYGVDADFDIPKYEDTSDSDSFVSSDSSSCEDAESAAQPRSGAFAAQFLPPNRKRPLSSTNEFIGPEKARSWLESL